MAELSSRIPSSEGEPRYRRVRLLSKTSLPKDTLFIVRRQGSVVVSEEVLFQFRPVSFGRDSEIALCADNRLCSGWQDSLLIVAHALDGSSQEIASVPAPSVPIPDAARDSVQNGIGNSDLRPAVAPALQKTRSAFTNLVITV